jgi:hypothetical protein
VIKNRKEVETLRSDGHDAGRDLDFMVGSCGNIESALLKSCLANQTFSESKGFRIGSWVDSEAADSGESRMRLISEI